MFFCKKAGFETDNYFDNSCIGIEATNIHEQKPVSEDHCRVTNKDDVLLFGYYCSPLGVFNVVI